ncbi:GNAT family N-acetyltransferase [Pontibacillus halophilus]|uniref:GNAT family N-acetyltransferase n=1 Tax=Pontibacillus halophilus TaxID=516704 RepID=UPI001B7FA0E8|nr:GNAT family protein [Pontibacillus halophilus]
MNQLDLETPRLILFPLSLEQAQSLMTETNQYPKWLNVPFDSLWPHDGLKALLPIYAENIETDDSHYGFGPWVAVDKHKEVVVGDVQFKGKPIHGEVEIGYFVSNIHRNQGYAKEAVEAIIQWAFQHESIHHVRAVCDANNVPSCRVLEACGFKRLGEDNGIIHFKTTKQRNHAI